jgi:hypothetical protein
MIGVEIENERFCGRRGYTGATSYRGSGTMVGGREESHSIRPNGKRDAILYESVHHGDWREVAETEQWRWKEKLKGAQNADVGVDAGAGSNQPGPMAL